MRPPRPAPRRASGRAARRAGAGPVADVREEVAGRDDRARRVAHVLRDHRGVVVAAARRGTSASSSSESASGSTAWISRCVAIAAGLTVSSQSRSCSRQSLPVEHLVRAREALRDLLLGRRPHLVVRRSRSRTASRGRRSASRRSGRNRRCRGRTPPDGSRSSSASAGGESARRRAPTSPGRGLEAESGCRCGVGHAIPPDVVGTDDLMGRRASPSFRRGEVVQPFEREPGAARDRRSAARCHVTARPVRCGELCRSRGGARRRRPASSPRSAMSGGSSGGVVSSSRLRGLEDLPERRLRVHTAPRPR